ncbi:MAG TPA: site-specific DNA-methyltransferase [Methanosarcinales archaeon]|nr:site-specific DNA-methyltransferase [Methanosarcinales archaeon]
MIETNLNGKTPNIAKENIQKLRHLFPDVFTEGKVDFEKLQQVLGNDIETSNERYNFSWNGKAKAIRFAQTPSMGTLRPYKQESKDWNTTQNLYIEGDNLEVLKLLQKSYHDKIKMIYIDPPYNTGGDFVYPDDFSDNIEHYKQLTGQIDSEGKSISNNCESSGRYHTDWLNMMYPRLRLARNLLTDDGIIFISIGNDEVENLKKICNEVFGEENFIVLFSRMMKSGGAKGSFYTPNIDYILAYAKFISKTSYFRTQLTQEQIERFYNKTETEGSHKGELYGEERLYKASLDARPNQRYYIKCPDGTFVIPPGVNFPQKLSEGEKVLPTSEDRVWKWIYERYSSELEAGNIVFKETNTSALINEHGEKSKWNIYNKLWLIEQQEKGAVPSNFIANYENRQSASELKELNIPFDFAKPVNLITYLQGITGIKENEVVLDFFSGSSSTAHAVIQLNAKTGGNRRFIMVQLPEPCDAKSEAFKAGFKNICEIGKERIRRAGEKIKEEAGLMAQNLDIGFKVFKLDSSNIRKWQPDYENLEHSLTDYIDNFLEGRTELDVVYEIMLKYGLDLAYPIDEYTIDSKKVYSIGFGMLIICLDNDLSTGIAKGILDIIKELAPETTRVVFKDNGFKTDSNKTNIKEILKCGGIEEFITL